MPPTTSQEELRTYQRARWKHYVRWLAFIGMVIIDASLLGSSWQIHVIDHKPFFIKEFVAYVLVLLCNLSILPSIVFEIDKVYLTDKTINLNNLLFETQETWQDLVSFYNPIYLKFAILKSKKFFYLLNKKDLEKFEELAQTILLRAPSLRK